MRKLYVVLAFPDGLSSNLEHPGVLGVYSNISLAYNALIKSCEGRHGVSAPTYQTCIKYLREEDFFNFPDREHKLIYAQIRRYFLNTLW